MNARDIAVYLSPADIDLIAAALQRYATAVPPLAHDAAVLAAALTESREQWLADDQPAADVPFFELRRGTPDEPHPLILGRYLDFTDATAHGIDALTARFGIADRLAWYPADDTETVHHLYAIDLGEEVETEWHIVAGAISATYNPDDEG